jgi:hypothetical protein
MKKRGIERLAIAMGLGLVGLALLDVYDEMKPESRAKIRRVFKEVLEEHGLIDADNTHK